MYGVEVYYIPCKYLTENTVIREVIQSQFDEAHPLEAYVNNYEEYEGAGTLLSKFGIEAKEEIRLTISRERYENYIAPLLQGKSNIKLSTRPKTGDLIWFPLDDRIMRLKILREQNHIINFRSYMSMNSIANSSGMEMKSSILELKKLIMNS